MTIQTTKRDPLPKKFLTAYGPKPKIKTTFSTKGRTKQNHKAECDINTIIDRFKRTGALPEPSTRQARYGDATGIDFQNAQLLVAEANGMFAELPAKIRDRFDNDPGKLMSFLENPRNRIEAEDLGLLKKPEATPQASGTPSPGTQAPAAPPEAPKGPKTNSPT